MVMRFVFMCMLALTGFLIFVQGEEEGGINCQQSPIDIQTWNVGRNESLADLKKNYSRAKASMVNKGYEIQVVWCEDAGGIEIGGVKYRLNQSHWHHPAEHTINGIRYPLELHMVHFSDDNTKIAVIGILYQFGSPDCFLTTLEEDIDHITNIFPINSTDLNVVNPKIIGVRKDAAYYRYTGSLTTSPFTEGVTWTILKQAKTVTQEQVDSLKKALNGMDNSRKVQPISNRIVQLYDISEHTKKSRSSYPSHLRNISFLFFLLSKFSILRQ